jgi:hypothetical protein
MRITDLFRSVTSPQIKLDPTIAYTDYRIDGGARPDVVSQLLYGDPDYYWTFFIINDKLKSGHAAWPMSDSQMEAYLTQEYDGYSVIQMADVAGHIITTTSCATTVAGVDFLNTPQYIVNPSTSKTRQVMKYDSDMQQIWVINSGSSDTFISNLNSSGGIFRLSVSSTGIPYTQASAEANYLTSFFPVSAAIGQTIASPGILPYRTTGRSAIHHYVFAPQIGDVVNFQDISGTVTNMIEAYANSYGGIVVNGTQYHYFTDPLGFALTAQDVHQILGNPGTTYDISPTNRIYPVSYSDWENDLNEDRSRIRVVNPTYIRAFVKQYRDLINA